MWQRIKNFPAYPWFLALYAVLYLYAQNLSMVRDDQALQAMLLALVGAGVLLALCWVLVRQAAAAGLLAAVWLAAFFSYGHVVNLLGDSAPADAILLPVWLVLAVLLSAAIWRGRARVTGVTPVLNLVFAFLLVMAAWPVAQYLFSTRPAQGMAGASGAPKVSDSVERPDVYYIILDGYPSEDYLRRETGYDNSAFTDALEARGFYVAAQARSNYGTTMVSLPSTLNMRYMAPGEAAPADGLDYTRDLLANSLVAREFQALGYTYVYMVSGFVPPSRIADINIDFFNGETRCFSGADFGVVDSEDSQNEWRYRLHFWPLLLETSLLRPLQLDVLTEIQSESFPWYSVPRVKGILDELKRIPAMPEATFTFAHILKPHEPVIMDREGNPVPIEVVKTNEEFYFFEQLEYLNEQTLAVVDAILAESDVPPIIILQADHGSDLGYSTAPDGTHRRFDILSAFHLPGAPADALPPDMVSVNTFRLLFDTYFGTDYGLLEPRLFDTPQGFDDLFFFVETAEDGRLNPGIAEHVALLLPGEDESSAPVIDVYPVGADGEPAFGFAITQADLAPYLDAPPEENTIIATRGQVMVIALDTGEFQINLGPDAEGRMWSVVFDGIPAREAYGFEIDYGG